MGNVTVYEISGLDVLDSPRTQQRLMNSFAVCLDKIGVS
jgi:hypothetical protein